MMKGRFWKRTAAGLLALLIVTGGVPVQPFSLMFDNIAITASAEDWTSCGDALYKITGTTMTIKPGVNSGRIAGFNDDCSNIKNVFLMPGVTQIDRDAFSGFSSLENVYIMSETAPTLQYSEEFGNPNNTNVKIYVKYSTVSGSNTIPDSYKNEWLQYYNSGKITGGWVSGDCFASLDNGTMTFCGLGAMDDNGAAPPWHSEKDNITSVVINEGVTHIGKFAFASCDNLGSVTIGSDVTSIGAEAFCECDVLNNITIPASVTNIDQDAFYNCPELKNVTIQRSDRSELSFGQDAFLESPCQPVLEYTGDVDKGYHIEFEVTADTGYTIDTENNSYVLKHNGSTSLAELCAKQVQTD